MLCGLEGVARTVRALCKVSIFAFSWALFFPCLQALRRPPKRASKTGALARECQWEKRQAAKSVKIDISDEDWQEGVDWLLRIWEESVCVRRGISKDGNKNTPARQKETPGILWRPSTSIWEHPP